MRLSLSNPQLRQIRLLSPMRPSCEVIKGRGAGDKEKAGYEAPGAGNEVAMVHLLPDGDEDSPDSKDECDDAESPEDSNDGWLFVWFHGRAS